MKSKLQYRHTVFACCLANFLQAISSVFPILLIPLKNTCGLSYTQFGILVTLNFCTQVASDIIFSKPVDCYGFRRFAVAAPLVSSLGLVLFALSPQLFGDNVFMGFCISIMVFAAGGGLQELLLSPILDALPTDDDKRSQQMSLMHSFFAWGQILFIPATTLLLWLWGEHCWQAIILMWAAAPVISSVLFTAVPLVQRVSHHEAMPISQLVRQPVFLLAVVAIIFGGATEVTMAQWASAFIERGLLIPKSMGDILGACGFALMLAVGRTLYAIAGSKADLHKLMLWGSLMSASLYLIAALSASPAVGLIACALTGFSASLLWPGSVSIVGRNLPTAGASLFALMSASGDVGASSGAFIVGLVADSIAATSTGGEQVGLRVGMAFAAIFPIICFVANLALQKVVSKSGVKTKC
ncbi:MFS transporter [Hydrogenoanaerobacterium sp.]|uniref:MFS transporter n=1 Tax=Hydrogenoanaerobacterium sp. TaxID=2953763 RepID=UPI002899E0D4|nr:MFS transporter [Hydrogenoanaerobacterium sp.]